ncbi:phage tail protein [Streptomyces aureus]
MGNDIEIRVRVANNTASGLAAVNRSLDRLRDQARDAGHGLDGLAARAAAASVALRALKDSAQDASRALRSLNTASRTTHTRMGDLSDRSRTLRRDTDDLDGSMRRLTGTMGGLRGSSGRLTVSSNDSGNAMSKLTSAALMLSPALIPVAASLAPIATSAGAAGLAVGVFGAAVLGQLVAMKDATDAQKKYDDAVQKYGRGSQQAAQAQLEASKTLAGMPAATQRAAAAVRVLKEQYQQWSQSLAGSTMPVVTKGLAVLGSLFPKLTPVVKGASEQMSRFMTILGGGVASGGFSKFMDSFAKFSTGVLSRANDGLVHFMRTMSEGGGAGAGNRLSEFMDYARRVGPQVGDTLLNLSQALIHLVAAASETGVSMLSVVNVLAKLVNAIPSGALSTMLQFAIALKAVKMAAAGMAALGGLSSVATAIGAMRTAAAGASGPLAGLAAAFGTLSRSAKIALVGTGIGLLVVAIAKLQQIGKTAPPDIDKMTTALGNLGRSGSAAGELTRVFGKDMEDLSYAVERVAGKADGMDKFNDTMNKIFSLGMAKSNSMKDAQSDIDAIDKGLANMVKGGKADLAAAAIERLKKNLGGGEKAKDFVKSLDDYKSAVADAALEQQLAADAMGIFGSVAQSTQAKLDAQKRSADGLRASLIALNDTNRSAYDGQIAFEAGMDALTASFKKNGATLDIHTEKGRANGTAMSQAAKAQDEMIASSLAAGDSLASMTEKSSTLRAEMMQLATKAFKGNTDKAREYVNTLMGTPSEIKTMVRLERQEAVSGLKEVEAAVRKTPGAKKVVVSTLNGAAIKALEAVGLKTKTLPDGKTAVFTANGKALGSIAAVARALRALNGKTATTWTYHNIRTNYSTSHSVSGGKSVHDMVGATGGLYTGKGSGFRYADGGLVRGPGTGTSDDVPAPWLSNGEFVVKKAAVDKYGEKFLQRLNDGQIEGPHFARGGRVKLTKAQQKAKAAAQAESQARHDAMGQLTISHFGQMAGYQRSEFGSGLGKPDSISSLVNSLNQWRNIIQKSTHGGTESRLLKQLDATGRSLLRYEKQLNSVTKSLESAKSKLADLKSAAASLASSVKGNLVSSANITKGASGQGTVTLDAIRGGMTASRDKVVAFANALKQLKAKGFSKSIIQQVAEAGIDGGGLETAGALLQASSSEVASINSVQGQIESAAGSAGKTTADAVYGGEIAKQTAVVKTLTASQNSLKKSMDKLAKAMEKAVEKAFKKKEAGGIVGMAASGGIRSGLTWVGEHGPELADLPVGSRVWSNPDSLRKAQAPWASMLNTPRRGGAPAASAGAAAGPGGQPMVIHVNIAGRDFGELWVDTARREVRARGSIEATLKPPRGR